MYGGAGNGIERGGQTSGGLDCLPWRHSVPLLLLTLLLCSPLCQWDETGNKSLLSVMSSGEEPCCLVPLYGALEDHRLPQILGTHGLPLSFPNLEDLDSLYPTFSKPASPALIPSLSLLPLTTIRSLRDPRAPRRRSLSDPHISSRRHIANAPLNIPI